MKSCEEIMTKDPTCCLGTDTVDKVAQIMKSEDVGAVPVVESQQTKRLVGIVTDRDLALRVVAAQRTPQSTHVEEVMSYNPVTCQLEDDVQKALDAMAQEQIRRIPVVDRNNHIVGIIAQADVATRIDNPRKTAAVVEEISQPTA
jgi:CBS domain-containing protein